MAEWKYKDCEQVLKPETMLELDRGTLINMADMPALEILIEALYGNALTLFRDYEEDGNPAMLMLAEEYVSEANELSWRIENLSMMSKTSDLLEKVRRAAL